jgi:hypothetical protein
MYSWYQKAAVCFAYLVDVPARGDASSIERAFDESDWFRRGWTLQELIAPEIVVFCDVGWNVYGQY